MTLHCQFPLLPTDPPWMYLKTRVRSDDALGQIVCDCSESSSIQAPVKPHVDFTSCTVREDVPCIQGPLIKQSPGVWH